MHACMPTCMTRGVHQPCPVPLQVLSLEERGMVPPLVAAATYVLSCLAWDIVKIYKVGRRAWSRCV